MASMAFAAGDAGDEASHRIFRAFMNRTMRLSAIAALLALTACDFLHPMPKTSRFCTAEKRTIPDLEIKVRLLTKVAEAGILLPREMRDYAGIGRNKALIGEAERKRLAEYIVKNPLCCQFVERDLKYPKINPIDPRSKYDDDSGFDNLFSEGYFANLYIDYKNSSKYVALTDLYKERNGTSYLIVGARNCGQPIFEDRG